MRALLVSAMLAGGLLPSGLHAQRGGAHGGAIARPGYGGARGNPLGNWREGNGRNWGWNNRFGQSGLGYPGYGWGYGALGYSGLYSDFGWPAAYGDGNQTPPVFIMMPPQEAPEPVPPPPPPEPARPVMHEYTWDTPGDAGATFSIVSRDGLVRQAVAVWFQDNEVRYTTAGGGSGGIAPSAIDCAATGLQNAQNKVKLSLPGCAPSR